MKAALKKRIEKMREMLEELSADMTEESDRLSEIFDSRTEKWQESKNGDAMQSDIDFLEDTATECESMAATFSEIQNMCD